LKTKDPNCFQSLVAPWRTVSTVATGVLLLLGDVDEVDGDRFVAEILQQFLSIGVHIDSSVLVLGVVERGNLWDVLILAFAFFLLQLERDTADRSALDTLHQMRRESRNLVPQSFRGYYSNLIADTLVGLEVEGELRVVTFNDDLGGLLDGLGADAAHVEEL